MQKYPRIIETQACIVKIFVKIFLSPIIFEFFWNVLTILHTQLSSEFRLIFIHQVLLHIPYSSQCLVDYFEFYYIFRLLQCLADYFEFYYIFAILHSFW